MSVVRLSIFGNCLEPKASRIGLDEVMATIVGPDLAMQTLNVRKAAEKNDMREVKRLKSSATTTSIPSRLAPPSMPPGSMPPSERTSPRQSMTSGAESVMPFVFYSCILGFPFCPAVSEERKGMPKA